MVPLAPYLGRSGSIDLDAIALQRVLTANAGESEEMRRRRAATAARMGRLNEALGRMARENGATPGRRGPTGSAVYYDQPDRRQVSPTFETMREMERFTRDKGAFGDPDAPMGGPQAVPPAEAMAPWENDPIIEPDAAADAPMGLSPLRPEFHDLHASMMADPLVEDEAPAPEREKMGRAKAAGMGFADGATLNMTDEIVAGGQYLKTMEEQGHRVSGPGETLLSPLTDVFGFPFRRKREAPTVSVEEARETARADADRERDIVRRTQQQAREDRPATYGTGMVGGAVATLPAGGAVVRGGQGAVNVGGRTVAAIPGAKTAGETVARVAKPATDAVGKAGRMISNIPLLGPLLNAGGKGVAPGMAYGGLAAAGEATDDRVMAAGEGLLPGAAGGFAGGAALKAIGSPLGILASVLARNPDKKALATIAREMNQHGVTPEAVRAQVKDYGRGNQPVFETAGEMLGPGNEGLQTALGNVPGPAKERLADAFTDSVRNLGRTMSGSAKRATGKDPDRYHETRGAHEEMRIDRDAKNYEAVLGPVNRPNRPPRDDWNMYMLQPRDGAVFETPIAMRPRFHRYAEKVAEDARLDGDTHLARDIGNFFRAIEAGQPPGPLSTRAINEIDKRITDDINKALAQERLSDVRIFNDLQAGLRQLDETTGLGAVREQSAIGFTAKSAFEEGRKAFRHGVDVEDVMFNLKTADPEIQDAYLTGMVRSMSDALANQSNLGGLADAAKKIAATPAMREKLEAALPKTQRGQLTANSRRFMDLLNRVSRHTERARQVYGNSATAPRQAAIEGAEASTSSVSGDALDLVGEVIQRQPGRVMNRMGQGIRNRVTRPGIYDPRINEGLGNRLGATGRRDILALLDEIEGWNNRSIPLSSDRANGMAARGGGFMAGTDAGANSAFGNDKAGTQAGMIVEAFERDMLAEYFDEATSPARIAEIEDFFGEDAAELRAIRTGETVH